MANLETLTQHDIPVFTFSGLSTSGKVVRVIDGDTVHVVVNYHGDHIRLVCRLNGIDTPEKTKTPEPAIKARNRLVQLCTNVDLPIEDLPPAKILSKKIDSNSKVLKVDFCGKEKYGRELIKLYDPVTNLCINDVLVAEGFAKEYHGGQKT